MIKTICLLLILIACICIRSKAVAQKNDTLFRPFSEWTLRFNPFSFIENFGGVHVGVETNLDKKKQLYLVSEYGIIFINNVGSGKGSLADQKNPNSLSGYRTKQELKWAVTRTNQRANVFVGLETNFQMVNVLNAGWFGMGRSDANGLYPYFKYQEFKEEISQLSGAIKYVQPMYFKKGRFYFEFFIGLGVLYRDVKLKNSEGALIQPDVELVYSEASQGVKPYVAGGFRLMYNLK